MKTLHKKWDDIRFIDLDEAFSLALTYKEFVKKNPVLKHFKQNRHRLKLMSYRTKRYKNHYEEMQENVGFFNESLKIYTEVCNFIYNGIKTYIDIYDVDDLKNYLVFDYLLIVRKKP